MFDLPNQVQVEDGVDLDDAVDDPEAEEEEENAGALAPGAKYHHTTQEIDAMKKKDLQEILKLYGQSMSGNVESLRKKVKLLEGPSTRNNVMKANCISMMGLSRLVGLILWWSTGNSST